MMSRRSGVGLAVVNGQLYAVGGFDGTTYLKTIEVFDQVTFHSTMWWETPALGGVRDLGKCVIRKDIPSVP